MAPSAPSPSEIPLTTELCRSATINLLKVNQKKWIKLTAAWVFELQMFRFYVIDPHVPKPAVDVVKLQHEEVGFVLGQVVAWSQVNRHIHMALDDAD